VIGGRCQLTHFPNSLRSPHPERSGPRPLDKRRPRAGKSNVAAHSCLRRSGFRPFPRMRERRPIWLFGRAKRAADRLPCVAIGASLVTDAYAAHHGKLVALLSGLGEHCVALIECARSATDHPHDAAARFARQRLGAMALFVDLPRWTALRSAFTLVVALAIGSSVLAVPAIGRRSRSLHRCAQGWPSKLGAIPPRIPARC